MLYRSCRFSLGRVKKEAIDGEKERLRKRMFVGRWEGVIEVQWSFTTQPVGLEHLCTASHFTLNSSHQVI